MSEGLNSSSRVWREGGGVSRNPLSLEFGRGKGLVTREGVTYRGVSIERDRKGYPSVLRLRRGSGQEVSTRSRLRQG